MPASGGAAGGARGGVSAGRGPGGSSASVVSPSIERIGGPSQTVTTPERPGNQGAPAQGLSPEAKFAANKLGDTALKNALDTGNTTAGMEALANANPDAATNNAGDAPQTESSEATSNNSAEDSGGEEAPQGRQKNQGESPTDDLEELIKLKERELAQLRALQIEKSLNQQRLVGSRRLVS